MPQLSVCLTFDFDALRPPGLELAEGNVATLSRGEFGAVAALEAHLERFNYPS